MIDLEMIDSTCGMNGIEYDFRGCKAELRFNGDIVKVTCLKTGKDLTQEYKEKYGVKK